MRRLSRYIGVVSLSVAGAILMTPPDESAAESALELHAGLGVQLDPGEPATEAHAPGSMAKAASPASTAAAEDASSQAAAPAVQETKTAPPREVRLLVDNELLHSPHQGIVYRRSKNMTDYDSASRYALYGSVVTGYDEGDGWLKVGDLYLPSKIDGVRVLTPPPAGDARGSDREKVTYLVDNNGLHSEKAGIAFRASKNLSDVATTNGYAAYGSTVVGTDEGDGWIRIDDQEGGQKSRYLPQLVNDHRVLVPQADAGSWKPASVDARAAAIRATLVQMYELLVKRPLLPLAIFVTLLCSAIVVVYRQRAFAALKASTFEQHSSSAAEAAAGHSPSPQAKASTYERNKDLHRVR
eukprot:TRINITY_DN123032_c0_g1_i1.p1 TRINITY_DN123032_c0_g1~~TRINITY_DN123032_c0_g1_i1.p1  ORF type:complete len:398 (-),score=70.78 TRINITY_DN123032_c0_g1_i1:107-1168(-)